MITDTISQFEPDHEERTPVELKITGNIPAYIAGVLYRTGPGGYQVDTAKGTIAMSHWFDGFNQGYPWPPTSFAPRLIILLQFIALRS